MLTNVLFSLFFMYSIYLLKIVLLQEFFKGAFKIYAHIIIEILH